MKIKIFVIVFFVGLFGLGASFWSELRESDKAKLVFIPEASADTSTPAKINAHSVSNVKSVVPLSPALPDYTVPTLKSDSPNMSEETIRLQELQDSQFTLADETFKAVVSSKQKTLAVDTNNLPSLVPPPDDKVTSMPPLPVVPGLVPNFPVIPQIPTLTSKIHTYTIVVKDAFDNIVLTTKLSPSITHDAYIMQVINNYLIMISMSKNSSSPYENGPDFVRIIFKPKFPIDTKEVEPPTIFEYSSLLTDFDPQLIQKANGFDVSITKYSPNKRLKKK